MMRIGVSSSALDDGWTAGQALARQAMAQGAMRAPDLAIAFCSRAVDAHRLFEGIRAEIGASAPILGGSAIGIITNDTISYHPHTSGLLLIEDETLQIETASAEGLSRDIREAGRSLGRKLPADPPEATLVFYDSIGRPAAPGRLPDINSSRDLLAGLESGLGGHRPLFGAGTLGDLSFSPTVQFIGDRVATQAVTALSLRGSLDLDWAVMHGCSLMDGIYHRITDLDGPVIKKLDGRPIVDIIDEMYGDTTWQSQLPLKRLTIGVNHGERFPQAMRELDYVNRLILGVTPDRSGIVIFEADLAIGTEIQFMLRDPRRMIESAQIGTEELLRRIRSQGRQPLLGFYIDCAGRMAAQSETIEEEAAEVQSVLNRLGIPLFGFYSGVELAPIRGRSRSLDWTGVLLVLSR